MKIKDLPPSTNLGGIKIKTSSGEVGYWKSQWEKGVWIQKELESIRMYPIFVEDLKETLEWEILEE